MNQKLWSSLTTAALIITTLGSTAPTYAGQPDVNDDASETIGSNVSQGHPEIHSSALTTPQMDAHPETIAPSAESASEQVATTLPVTESTDTPSNEVSKVGEYQSQEETEDEGSIAIIQPHELNGRPAAILYVRDIPVLTFLGSPSSSENTDQGVVAETNAPVSLQVKVGSTQNAAPPEATVADFPDDPESNASEDPVWRATAIAARINQLYLNQVDAETITVEWDGDRQQYVIKVSDEPLVEINSDTILPDTTGDTARDALQATNRLRRLLGDAPPLREIAGRPEPSASSSDSWISLSSIRARLRGMASWYGPGFHGNRSANGEVFNQHGLTAAHRTLPFGTQVRVTNLRTGRSVIVRITDRGPFSRGRVIDLSAGAARVIGLIQAGVAPVQLEVMGTRRTASN